MKTLPLGSWEMEYVEAEDAIRLLAVGDRNETVLFRLTKDNISGFLTAIDNRAEGKFVLSGQPMKPQEHVLVSEGDYADDDFYAEDDYYALSYEIRNGDLSKFYDGEEQEYTVVFEYEDEQRSFVSMMWAYWAIDHLIAEAV